MQNSDTCVQWNLDLGKIVATTNYDHHADGYKASAPHSEIRNCYLCKNTLNQTVSDIESISIIWEMFY